MLGVVSRKAREQLMTGDHPCDSPKNSSHISRGMSIDDQNGVEWKKKNLDREVVIRVLFSNSTADNNYP